MKVKIPSKRYIYISTTDFWPCISTESPTLKDIEKIQSGHMICIVIPDLLRLTCFNGITNLLPIHPAEINDGGYHVSKIPF